MFTKAGILLLTAGFVVAVFTGISKFMGTGNFWVDLTISKLLGDDTTKTLINFSDEGIMHDSFYFLVVDLPFSGFLIGLGVLLLFLSLFIKSH